MMLLAKIAMALAAVYLLIALVALVGQRRLMYFPDPDRVPPASMGLDGVEEMILQAPDGAKLVAWYAKADPGQPTILYFHGNAGNLASRAERTRRFMAQGLGMFVLSYRGYGGSTGSPSEAANVADAKLAYEALIGAGVAPDDIVLYGESLGSGVAVQLAAQVPVGGVILDAPYTSIVDVAAEAYPVFPVRLALFDRYETLRHLPDVKAPILIVHGEDDTTIPVRMGRAVHAAANAPKKLVTVPGAGHSDHHLFGSEDEMFRWLGSLQRGSPPEAQTQTRP
jgi:uncharacterized protein